MQLVSAGLVIGATIGTRARSQEELMLRRAKKHNTIASAFEDEFALEILKSDQLRVTILIGVLSSTLLLLLSLSLVSFEQFQQTFHGNFKGFLLTSIIFAGGALVAAVAFNVRRTSALLNGSFILQLSLMPLSILSIANCLPGALRVA